MTNTSYLPVDREAWRFVLVFALVTLFFFTFSEFLGFVGVILTGWCLYFFRDPNRVTPQGEGLIVSPADGVVSSIKRVMPPKELDLGDEEYTRISIFLNVFNVHVNRIPIGGKLEKSIYHPGQFLNAALDKASDVNERQTYLVKTESGIKIPFVQIAGLIARRIRCDVSEGSQVTTGARFGLIRFGSRMDVYLPDGHNPQVVEGQIMIAGETILCDLTSPAMERTGVLH